MAGPTPGQKYDYFEEFSSLSSQLAEYLSDNEELTKQMGIQEDIARQLSKIQKEKGKATGSELNDLESFTSQLKKQLTLQGEINDKVAELKKNNIFNEWSDKLRAVHINIKALLSDWRVSSALLLTSLSHHVGEFVKEWAGASKELGLSGEQAFTLAGNLGGASLEGIALGVSLSESREAAAALVSEANTLRLATKENIKEVGRLSSWYNVSAESGAELVELSHKTELNTIKFAESLAIANGVAPGKVMSQIAENSSMFAGRTKESTKNLISAAVSANKLGIEMASLKSMSESLLDVETSMANEQELSVLTGKNINLGKARELMFMEDEAGMLKEVLNQMGSYEEFQNQNIIARKKMAEMFGMDLDEFSTMLKNQEELNNQQSIHHSWLGRNWLAIKGIGKSAWEYKDTIGSTLLMLVNMKQLNVFSAMAKGIKSVVGGLWGMIKQLLRIKTIQKATDISGAATGAAGGIGGALGPGVSSRNLAASAPGGAISKGMGAAGKVKGMAMGNPIVNWINSWKFMDKGALVNFALATGVLVATLPLLALGLMMFNKVEWQSAIIGMGSLAAMVGIMRLIGKDTKGLIQGAIGMAILSAALIPLGFGLSMFTKNINGEALLTAGAALVIFTGMVFGLGALIAGPGAIIFGAGVIGFIALGGALMVLGAGLSSISEAMGSMKDNLGAIVPMVSELASITPQLFLIGAGFASMGVGLIGLAAGLAVMAPLIPILGAITSLTSGTIGGNKEKGKSKEEDALLSRLDKLITLLEEGGTVQMDGKAMGKWVAYKIDEMNVYPK